MRFRIDFGYDGTEFSGWAAQPTRRTVEGELTSAVATVTRMEAPKLTVAGRTDAGVHARGAVCHVDVPSSAALLLPGRSDRSPQEAMRSRLNGVLPSDISVHRVDVVTEDFDARFSAVHRRYSYRIADDEASWDPIRRRDTVRVSGRLNVEAMNAAARQLEGLNDFASFCKKREGATTIRTLLEYSWAREVDGTIVGTVRADAFCHSMVRALVGGVVPVGQGKRRPEWLVDVMSAKARQSGVAVMPPQGLCLEEVAYPPPEEFAARSREARSRRDGLG